MDLSLLWAPYGPLDPGIVVAGTSGTAHVQMDGSWSIVTAEGRTGGPPVEPGEPFERQWQAFRGRRAGFGLGDLEPTLEIIDRIYEEHAW